MQLKRLWIGLCVSLFVATVQAASRPNMVLFISDDLSYFDIGCYGGQAKTPNIDQLAAEGIKFTSCYQSACVCSPTRQNLYTGLYPMRSGAYPQGSFVKPGTKSMPHYLKALGYRVALIGKRHFNPMSAYPFEYLNDHKDGIDADSVGAFIADCGDVPFVLIAASNEPHYAWDHGDPAQFNESELILPPNWIDTKETRQFYAKYLAETSWMDGEVGDVIDQLKKYKKYDDTVFFYTSEQGSSFPYAKWTCYEAGIHTALIARWPGKIKAGSINDDIIEYTDVLPTFIELAGGTVPEHLDGQSFKSLLLGGSGGKDYTFAQQTTRGEPWGGAYFGIRSVRDDRYTYIINFTPEMLFECHLTRYGDGFFNSWREAAWRGPDAKRANKLFLGYITRPPVELYDRQNDPWEMKNLAGQEEYTVIEQRLSKRLREWMVYCGDKGQETEMEALEHQWKRVRRGTGSASP